MAFVFSIKDTYRQAVEAATGGNNTVMYDDLGNPSIMVRVPKFYLDEVITGATHVAHPAFIVNGIEKSEIWISKFQNILHNNRGYSVPGVVPTNNMEFNSAKRSCEAKGTGWHLMTNVEWAAIALWCKKNGTMPRGNDSKGASYDAPYEHGLRANSASASDFRTLTGSGPASWYHNGTTDGIADLCGNVYEWVDGLKLVNGKIYIHNDNDFDTGNTEGNINGWVDTKLYMDCTIAGSDVEEADTGGDPILSNSITNKMYTGTGDQNGAFMYSYCFFESFAAKEGVTVPDLLKYLALFPADSESHGNDRMYIRNYGERVACRGGTWTLGVSAGVFSLSLHYTRSYSAVSLGFRSAFISDI